MEFLFSFNNKKRVSVVLTAFMSAWWSVSSIQAVARSIPWQMSSAILLPPARTDLYQVRGCCIQYLSLFPHIEVVGVDYVIHGEDAVADFPS